MLIILDDNFDNFKLKILKCLEIGLKVFYLLCNKHIMRNLSVIGDGSNWSTALNYIFISNYAFKHQTKLKQLNIMFHTINLIFFRI